MNFHNKARILVREAAIGVAHGRRLVAEKLIYEALKEAQNETEPRLKKLEAEVVKLRKALADYYSSPPDEDEW